MSNAQTMAQRIQMWGRVNRIGVGSPPTEGVRAAPSFPISHELTEDRGEMAYAELWDYTFEAGLEPANELLFDFEGFQDKAVADLRFPNQADPSAPPVKGAFVVEFEPGTAHVSSARAFMDGVETGQRIAVDNPTNRPPGLRTPR